jgi:hypothetical protein
MEEVGTTIVTVEEQMRGWMAAIAKERQAARQTTAYRELGKLFEFFARMASPRSTRPRQRGSRSCGRRVAAWAHRT